MNVSAEWNIRQQDAADAQHGRQRHRGVGHRAPPAAHRPQSPRNALAQLGKAGVKASGTPDGAAFWFGQGLVHVS